MSDISNSDNIIDSRDVIRRIEELEADRAILVENRELAREEGDSTDADEALSEWDEGSDCDELMALRVLAEECDFASDWRHGECIVRDSYFVNYARELAEDIGAVSKDQSWPNNHIDWEAAADALQQDYTSVDYDDVTYWIRS